MKIDGRKLIRIHAGALMLITITFTIAAYLGFYTGIGPYGVLSEEPLVIAGLVQAYPLMGLVALCMWYGAEGARPGFYSAVGIAAHAFPLLVYLFLWTELLNGPLAAAIPFGLSIHLIGTALEIGALVRGYMPLART